jgi:hypothetical protein
MTPAEAASLDGLLNGLGAEVTCPSVCQVAMFLSTATDLPNTGDSASIAKSALACCREILCSKFHTEESCQWISSGDSSWKSDLSSDLDQVEVFAPPSHCFNHSVLVMMKCEAAATAAVVMIKCEAAATAAGRLSTSDCGRLRQMIWMILTRRTRRLRCWCATCMFMTLR